MKPFLIRSLFERRRATTINLGRGEPNLPIDPELLERGLHRYRTDAGAKRDNQGLVELRQRVADYHGYPHMKGAANVVMTCGATGAMTAILLAIADPGDEIIVLDPSFWCYRRGLLELFGVVPKVVPMRPAPHFTIDVDAIRDALSPRTRAVVLSSPSNPTGRIDGARELERLAEVLAGRGVWIVSDEVYREFVFEGEAPPPSPAQYAEHTIVLSSFSKACSMTDFRLGYVLAPDHVVSVIARCHQASVVQAPVLPQQIALTAMEEPGRWLRLHWPAYAAQRAAMLRAVEQELGLPHAPAEGGFYVYLQVPAAGGAGAADAVVNAVVNDVALAEALLTEADVLTIPGGIFGSQGAGFLRLSYAASERDVAEGVRRIGAYLQQHHRHHSDHHHHHHQRREEP